MQTKERAQCEIRFHLKDWRSLPVLPSLSMSLMPNAPVIHEPVAGERHRVAYLLRGLKVPAEARLLAVVRTQPVERFVAAAAWWPEGSVARFHLVCVPGIALADLGAPLLDQVTAQARAQGLEILETAGLTPDDPDKLAFLRHHGFTVTRSERFFEVAYDTACARVTRLHAKYQAQMPPTWRTDPLRQHRPEIARDLLAPHRLMPPDEIVRLWLATSPPCFDSELSCVLCDGSRPFGAFLLRRSDDLLAIDAQVVSEPNRRLRSLADIFLLNHVVVRAPAGGMIRRIRFRSGATEHRQTANLALRMGGHEFSRQHVLAKPLSPSSR